MRNAGADNMHHMILKDLSLDLRRFIRVPAALRNSSIEPNGPFVHQRRTSVHNPEEAVLSAYT
jgi:hypothetical protein